MHEFELIKKFFTQQSISRHDVILGIGDDCAIINVPRDQQLAITTDTLVNGVHFPTNTSPYDIGYKSLAVNLSDLAAMGASPAWITLALTLPEASEDWLTEFSRGFFELASRYKIQLIGGDITRGPLTITIAAHGLIPKHLAITRSGAKPGDLIYVTNTLGDAGLALLFLNKEVEMDPSDQNVILTRLNRPEPRTEIGELLRGIAHAAIDISDGLAADLGHILKQSHVGATIHVDQLPLSNTMRNVVPHEKALSLALNAGDDYELCFTIPQDQEAALMEALKKCNCSYTCIGTITATHALDLQFKNGKKYHDKPTGYRHF